MRIEAMRKMFMNAESKINVPNYALEKVETLYYSARTSNKTAVNQTDSLKK